MAAYRHAGVWLPRVSREQWNAGPHVGLGGLAPGDLVFVAYNAGNPATIHHVGMYVGAGVMVEAPYSGARVRIASIGPPRLHRRRPPDRLTVSGGRKGFFLLDFGGRDPRGPTPRTSI